MAVPFKNGDIVRFVPSRCTESERNLVFMVTNVNEVTERCNITLLNTTMSIPPTETVAFTDITLVKEHGLEIPEEK